MNARVIFATISSLRIFILMSRTFISKCYNLSDKELNRCFITYLFKHAKSSVFMRNRITLEYSVLILVSIDSFFVSIRNQNQSSHLMQCWSVYLKSRFGEVWKSSNLTQQKFILSYQCQQTSNQV